MSHSYSAPEKLGPKKFMSKTAPISTINIGVEDLPEPHSSEEAHNGSSQRPPRRLGGSVHFNMSTTSKVSPRHTIQVTKTAPSPKANNGNGPVRDSSTVFSSIASRGRKIPGSKFVNRDINTSDVLTRQVCSCLL